MNGEKPVSGSDAWDFAASIGAQYIETSSYTQVSKIENKNFLWKVDFHGALHFQEKVKDVFDAVIWDALLPKTLPPKPPLWKRMLCLA